MKIRIFDLSSRLNEKKFVSFLLWTTKTLNEFFCFFLSLPRSRRPPENFSPHPIEFTRGLWSGRGDENTTNFQCPNWISRRHAKTIFFFWGGCQKEKRAQDRQKNGNYKMATPCVCCLCLPNVKMMVECHLTAIGFWRIRPVFSPFSGWPRRRRRPVFPPVNPPPFFSCYFLFRFVSPAKREETESTCSAR